MRQISNLAVNAFLSATPFQLSNTTVVVKPNVTVLRLHGNEIAFRYNDPEKTLSISTCGWDTLTTRERLNAIPGVHLQRVKGRLFLNGSEWDGKLIDIK